MSSPSSSSASPSRRKAGHRKGGSIKPGQLTNGDGATAMQWGHFRPPPLPRCAQTGMPEHLEIWKKEARVVRHNNKVEEHDLHDRVGTGGDIDGLRAILRHKHGSAARGWRLEIAASSDKEGHDHAQVGVKPVTYGEFTIGLRRVGYGGKVLSLWRALCKVSGTDSVGLEHVEPRLAEQLDAVASGVVEQYEMGCQQAWDDIDRDHNARMTADEFERWLVEHEIVSPDGPQVNPRLVFETLCISGRGTVTVEELRFLDYWAFHRLAHLSEQAKSILEESKVSETSEATECRLEAAEYTCYNRLYDDAKRRKDKQRSAPTVFVEPKFEEVPWSPPPPEEKRIPGLADLRKHLERKYGSVARAWRTILDVKNVGMLSPSEFGMACRATGWPHPHHVAWEEARQVGGGAVTLRALDPGTAQVLDTLRQSALENFGDLSTFWTVLLDPDGDGTVSRTEFLTSICNELSVSKADAIRAFGALDNAGTGWLSISEIGFLEAMDGTRALSGNAAQSMQSSYSTGALPDAGRSRQVLSPDGSWAQADASISSWETSSVLEKKPRLWDNAKSTRNVQNRTYANAHSLKHMFLKGAVLDRSQSSTSLQGTLTRSFSQMDSAVYRRATPLTDVFRFTNEFYREGVRRIAAHHEALQEQQGAARQEQQQAERELSSYY